MADDDVENLKLKSTAIDVAKACGGLPIALTTIGRAMRNKSVLEWKNALRELRTPSVRANKMEDAYNKLHALLHELKDSCLLVEGDSNEVFRCMMSFEMLLYQLHAETKMFFW
ncbi:hypothetical protein WN944_007465 [Citrus x changshan-huyou]|uniref:NB-ARC domain-containing protein n=1 Tax=Citrus x changshan-huyou TaxID=2935761 RepID=A0AAP0QUE6_9ROSI